MKRYPASLTAIGENLLYQHHAKLTVTCPENSAMHAYLKEHYPEVAVAYPK